ncbi:MAG: diheme cytochrome c [Gammaproteobacteria bacterium]|nr:diheme cytochrome c [Gammaproteobacteria bacterium]
MHKLKARIIRLGGAAAISMFVAASNAQSAPAIDATSYVKECGACHIAFPAEFLPARSWEKLLTTLDDHFGENAELAAEDTQAIRGYLSANAADRSGSRRGQQMLRGVGPQETPLRITELSYFIREHDEIPRRMSLDNPEVKSMSRCNACHTRAAEGSFSEHEVTIPGYRDWDD